MNMTASTPQTTHPILPIIEDTSSSSEQRTQHFLHLLNLNHTTYSILYNNNRFHNHTPHFLGSAYLYGGSPAFLQSIYNDVVNRGNMEPWKPSPARIDINNYREYLGRGEYQRSWVEFFGEMMRDEMGGGDEWQAVVIRLLFESGVEGERNVAPMSQCLGAALGHPLIHLGYAFELGSRELAVEALGLVATCYDEGFAALLDSKSDQIPVSVAKKSTSDLSWIFHDIHSDEKLPTFSQPGDEHIDEILGEQEYVDIVVSYVNSWEITDSMSQLSQAYHLASLLLISTAPDLSGHGYDFFLVHMLTTAHAVRVLLPYIPTQHHGTLLRGWLLTAVLAYIAQNRPKLDPVYIKGFDLEGRDWGYVRRQALEGRYSTDAHFVKACRALHVAAETWRDTDDGDWFLKSAVRFVSEFDGWGGFDVEAEDAELVREQRLKDGIYVR